MEFRTDDPALIDDALRETKRIANKYKTVRICSRKNAFFDSAAFKKYFNIKKAYDDKYGVFAQLSENDLPEISLPDGVSVFLVSNKEKSRYAELDDDTWDGLSSLIKYGNDTDKLFILKENGVVCGYLMADNSHQNIYDIANVFVLEPYRGKNYGQYLTVTFANDCYANGLLPHYGTAVSEYSEAVAIKSGFTETYRQYYADVKAKLFVK